MFDNKLRPVGAAWRTIVVKWTLASVSFRSMIERRWFCAASFDMSGKKTGICKYTYILNFK